MKLWTLIENSTSDAALACEHGLSLYIETNGQRILFDTGQTDAFADNAEKMGVDLRRVDLCILSHGHYDHGGGIRRFLEINHTARVFVNRHAFDRYYNADGKYIGLDEALRDEKRIVFTQDSHVFSDRMSLHTCAAQPRPFKTPPFGMQVNRRGQPEMDDFRHEQYLLVREGEKRILISGCSHKGVLNIASWFAPDVFIGGFHLMKVDPTADAAYLQRTAAQLLAGNALYFTGHCTGDMQYDALKIHLGDRLQRLCTGAVYDV